ncbi:glycosyl transferase family 2 [Ruminiclostridium sufflavum DSM 19573]|uniref:Glycosyl transferase family 2 n=1 Tax=Ruminiclostridium sufflavum DSM 19573 TaxID=1121337 RepID=A0A318XM70_9FIRM|nr:glycosyltransferase family 2 protein [Ruminiclostridium sufflavum]PYG87802.1 glycosyl transferase family 2 [Ruminiclostridium sufflavum DSM 19573]
MRKNKVSIIIPCYNAENTIISALSSLKAQLCKDFEVIIVNDGSTDNTLLVTEEYMKDSGLNYTLISHEDKGVSVARNNGIAASGGEYLMFLDADDIYHPAMVKYFLELIESTEADTVFCSFTRDVGRLPDKKSDTIGKAIPLDSYKLQEYLLFQYIPNGMWSYIYKKDILDKFNIRFTPGRIGEDREFTWKYLCHCSSGIALDMQLYGYCDNPCSVGNNISINKIEFLSTMDSIDNYLKENNSSFHPVFQKFGRSRILWSILKIFSKADRKDLFEACMPKKEARKHMARLLLYPDFKIKITSLLYIISPALFFECIKIFMKWVNKTNV